MYPKGYGGPRQVLESSESADSDSVINLTHDSGGTGREGTTSDPSEVAVEEDPEQTVSPSDEINELAQRIQQNVDAAGSPREKAAFNVVYRALRRLVNATQEFERGERQRTQAQHPACVLYRSDSPPFDLRRQVFILVPRVGDLVEAMQQAAEAEQVPITAAGQFPPSRGGSRFCCGTQPGCAGRTSCSGGTSRHLRTANGRWPARRRRFRDADGDTCTRFGDAVQWRRRHREVNGRVERAVRARYVECDVEKME